MQVGNFFGDQFTHIHAHFMAITMMRVYQITATGRDFAFSQDFGIVPIGGLLDGKRSMKDGNLALSEEEREHRRADYAKLDREELDRQAVAAILEHRRLIEADEIIYGEWVLAADDRKTPSTVVRALQEQYVLRQQQSLSQQEMLEDMLDVLGYIPDTGD